MKYSRQQLAAQYQNLLADIYQGCAEPSPAVLPPEMQIQSWWASGLLPLHGVCQNGDNVRILERGRWNRLPGPDFTHAEIELSGTRLRGDIEIDSRAQDWEAHGHGANPAFDNVVLTDSVNKNMLKGNYCFYNEKTGYAFDTDKAMAVDYSQGD